MSEVIRIADINDFQKVKEITHTTIKTVYPRYYPAGTVQFFLNHHSDENILSDIKEEKVYLLISDNEPAGTVTLSGNEIDRLFVLPGYQKKGYGTKLIDFAEETIGKEYDIIMLDASLVPKKMYLKRGFETVKYDTLETPGGDYICYDSMKKILKTERGCRFR